MRIAFVLAGLGAGGAERVVSLITGEWAAKGHEVTVIAFDRDEDPVYHSFDARIRFVRLALPGRRRKPAAVLRRVIGLRRTLRALKPDLVVSFLTKINALTLTAGIGLGIPTIVSERNNPGRQAAHPFWNLILARLYRRASAIVMQTSASIEGLPASVRTRAVVIPNPIVAPVVPGTAQPDQPVLAAVGRLEHQKGFDLLLDAFGRVAGDHPGWRLIIWGEGPGRPALESHIRRLGLEDRVSLPGLSERPGSWAEETTAFILSSRFEGYPNALGEAMAIGLPVVAFDCRFGPSEMIRDEVDGLLVPAEDVEALGAAIARLMGDLELRKRLGCAARSNPLRLNCDQVVANWDAVVLKSLSAKI